MITSNTYLNQLQDALNGARQEIVTQTGQARSTRTTALEAKEVALHDQVEAKIGLDRAEDVRLVAAEIDAQAHGAKLAVANVAASSEDSSAAAANAAALMATAAASVRAAVAALEGLTQDSSGMYKLIHRNDAGDDVDTSGQAADEALDAALESMNRLKSLCLDSTVIAAQSQAATAAQTFTMAKSQLDDVATAAVAHLARANDLTKKAVTLRNQTADFYATQTDPFDEATEQRDAYQEALRKVDEKTAGLIEVTINHDGPVQLLATFQPQSTGAAPLDVKFTAVKAQSAPGFKYTGSAHWVSVPGPEPATLAARLAEEHKLAEAKQQELEIRKHLQHAKKSRDKDKVHELQKELAAQKQVVAQLNKDLETKYPATRISSPAMKKDADGEAIAYGQSYCVFVTWTCDMVDPDGDLKKVRLLSVPSVPTLVSVADLAQPEAPQVVTAGLQAGAFLVAVKPPVTAPENTCPANANILPHGYTVSESRLFIVPKPLYLAYPIDELLVASATSAANYTSFKTPLPLEADKAGATSLNDVTTVASSLWVRNTQEAGLANETPNPKDTQIGAALAPACVGSTLVYFGLYGDTPAGQVPPEGPGQYYIGDYTDAFGDPIDLAAEEYKVAVVYLLSVPAGASGSRQAQATPDPMLEVDPSVAAATMILSETVDLPPRPKPSPVPVQRETPAKTDPNSQQQ